MSFRWQVENCGANGGIAIDIHVSMSGAKVASTVFGAGQQSLRLLE